MKIRDAINLIEAAGMSARFVPSDDCCCDDQIELLDREDIGVQIASGLFVAYVYSGEGNDFAVTHGKLTRDPVAAAREAVALALA